LRLLLVGVLHLSFESSGLSFKFVREGYSRENGH
jgi:hypothetical protein